MLAILALAAVELVPFLIPCISKRVMDWMLEWVPDGFVFKCRESDVAQRDITFVADTNDRKLEMCATESDHAHGIFYVIVG